MKRTKKLTLALMLMVLVALAISGCYGPGMTPGGFGGVTVSADGSQAYLALNNFIYAVDLSNGLEAWRYPAKADPKKVFYTTPELTGDGQIIVGNYPNIYHNNPNSLFSINPQAQTSADAQKENWVFTPSTGPGGRFIAAPLIISDTIYAPNDDGNLYAINMDGLEVWKFSANGQLWSKPSVSANGDTLYISSMNHFLYAVNSKDGSEIWRKDLGSTMVGTPAVGNDKLFIGNFNNEMVAVNPADGSQVWTQKTEGWAWSGPALNKAKDTLYFGDIKGYLYALNTTDGSSLWRYQSDGAITSTPTVTEDHIYFTTDKGTLFALKLDGTVDWKQTITSVGKLYASPVIAGDTILVVVDQDKALFLAAVPISGGAPKWTYNGQAPKK